jgi:hypothetical protein
MTRWTVEDVARMRLLSQRLVDPMGSPTEVVRHLTCTQAQDFPGSTMSIALRTTGRSLAEVYDAYDAREIVRSWPMRGTLFAVAAEDLGWMLDVMGEPTLRSTQRRRLELGLPDEVIERSEQVAREAIPAEGLSRSELLEAWTGAGVPVDGGRGYHQIAHLALSQVICLGPTRRAEGRAVEQLFVLSEDWLPATERLTREEAVTRWFTRYVLGHGPVAEADFMWWSKFLRRDLSPVVADPPTTLTSIEVDGVRHWVDPEVLETYGSRKRATAAPLLLPGFDEVVLGYGDRSPVMTDEQERVHVVPGKNGVFRPTVVQAGRALGTWTRPKGKATTVDVIAFDEDGLPGPVERALPRLTQGLPR